MTPADAVLGVWDLYWYHRQTWPADHDPVIPQPWRSPFGSVMGVCSTCRHLCLAERPRVMESVWRTAEILAATPPPPNRTYIDPLFKDKE